jgi:RNA polymerase sigma factor (sigma-70 family)
MTPWALISPARLAGSGLLRTQSDARLVDLVRAGNDRAFEAIVLRYHRPLMRHCRRLLPAPRAEDAVQQTFLHALEAMRADQRELQLAAWLHRIAHNAAIDTLRRLDSHWEELDERVDGVEPAHAAVERRARFRSVVAAFGALPERQRQALALRELEGRSYDEIAATLGVSGAGVRQLLNRARNAMRAGASALVPPTLVTRMATSPAGVRVTELADPPGTSALLAKGTAAVAASAVAVLAVSGGPSGDRLRSPDAHAGPRPPALEGRADAGGRYSDGRTVRTEVGGRRSASPDRGEQRAGGHGGGPAGRRPDSGRNTASPGGVEFEGDARETAPTRGSGRDGALKAVGGEGEDDAIGGSPGGRAPASPSDADDDEATAAGDDGPDQDDTASGDDGADDEASLVGNEPSDDDVTVADDDAAAPSDAPAAASPAGAGGDDDDDLE